MSVMQGLFWANQVRKQFFPHTKQVRERETVVKPTPGSLTPGKGICWESHLLDPRNVWQALPHPPYQYDPSNWLEELVNPGARYFDIASHALVGFPSHDGHIL